MPFLPASLDQARQTNEGTVMIATAGKSSSTIARQSRRERRDGGSCAAHVPASCAPQRRADMAGIRVMPQDGFPIYDHSESAPGAFVRLLSFGVTLASNHAFEIARMVAAGALSRDLVGAFTARRFGVAGNGPALPLRRPKG